MPLAKLLGGQVPISRLIGMWPGASQVHSHIPIILFLRSWETN
jgi:hypothetical protein